MNEASGPAAVRRRPNPRVGAAFMGAMACGALVVLLSTLGPILQAALLLVLGLGLPLLLLFVLRPHRALTAYLFVLPLAVPVPIAMGLNAGETLTLLVLVLGGVSLLYHPHRYGSSLRRLRPVFVPLLALIGVSVVSLLVNDLFTLDDIASALFKFVAFGVLALLVHVHAQDARTVRLLFAATVAGAGAVALYTLVAYLLGWSYSAEFDWNRPMGTFENWNLLGGYMALLALPTLGFAASAPRGVTRLVFGVFFLMEVAALLLSLTLGSMLGLIVGAAFVSVFVARMRLRTLLTPMLLALAVGSAVFATNPLLRDKVTRIDERALDRLKTYATGAAMFRDKFWWGFGSEQNMTDVIWFGKADYGVTVFGASGMVPHNAWLKIAVEKGVFGVVAFTILMLGSLVLLFRHGRRLRRGRDAYLYYGVAAGVLACLVQNVTNDLLLHARVGIIFFCMIALLDRLAELESLESSAAPAALARQGA